MWRVKFFFLLFPLGAIGQTTSITLEEALRMAIENNLDVVIAKNETAIGSINNNWGNAGALPIVSASVNNNLANNDIRQNLANGTEIKRDGAAVNNFNSGLLVSWRVFDGMRMFASKKRLEELEKMGQVNFTRQINLTVFNTRMAYYQLIRLRRQQSAITEVIAFNEERVKIAEMKFRVGSAAKSDLLQAEVDLNEQQILLLTARNEMRNWKTNLNNLLNRAPETEFEIADTVFTFRPPDLAAMQQKIETENPDLLLANSNREVLAQNKKEINAQRLPSVTLNGGYNYIRNKSEGGFTLLNQTNGPTAGVGLAIPIFNGGVVKQQLQVADINIRNQDASIRNLRNQLQASLTNAFHNYSNGLDVVKVSEKNLGLIKENNQINLERFRKMSITSLELRQGQVSYSEAQNRLIAAQFQCKQAEAEMQLLCGEAVKE
jgi:outer membrane protein TolC